MEPPAAGNQRSRPRPHRKPLQPRNAQVTPAAVAAGNLMKPKPIQISPFQVCKGDADKENRQMYFTAAEAEIGPLEASLAEELGAVRRRKERLRAERGRTEKLLRERDLVLNRDMWELERRGEEQRKVEIQIQSLIRLKDLRSSCTRTPFQSLRAKEQEKRNREAQLQGTKCIEGLAMKESAETSSIKERE